MSLIFPDDLGVNAKTLNYMSFQPFTGASLPQWAVDALAASKVSSGYFTGKGDWDPSAGSSFTTNFVGKHKSHF